MQMGGNANATTFFEQHNCTTKDSQQKYNSRAAQLYREKLHQAALKAQRTYGTKIVIDDTLGGNLNRKSSGDATHDDFFHESTHTSQSDSVVTSIAPVIEIKDTHIEDKSHEGPNVMAALSGQTEPTVDSSQLLSNQIKSNILQKKPVQTKKKGLGAQKVNADFKEIERVITEQEKNKELELINQAKNKEEEEKQMEKQMASMKLAYNNLDKQREKEEAKLMHSDPKKAQQLERLGMAVGSRSSGISHSALTDMQIIQQEGVSRNGASSSSYSSYQSKVKDSFMDDFDSSSFKYKSSSKYGMKDDDDLFKGFNSSSKSSDWVVVDDKFTDETLTTSIKTSSSSNETGFTKSNYSSTTNTNSSAGAATLSANGEATKRFANAKSISSDQYFGTNRMSESEMSQSKLTKFQGSTSISSEDYFGDGKTNKNSSYSAASLTPDLSVIKHDLKEGVTKVAGKLSNMASNVMSSLQDRY